MIRMCITALTGLMAVAFSASAQQHYDNFPYWYVGLNGQLAFLPDADVSGSGLSGEASFDPSYAVGASLGYRPYAQRGFFHNARFEMEYHFRDNDFDSFDGAAGSLNLDGQLQGHIVMANMLYDFDTPGKWTPYVGGGLGVAFWEFRSDALGVDSEDENFAYQLMTGIYYEPESLPQTEWGVGYRYFATTDPDFSTNAGNRLEHDFNSHNLEFLARFRF